MRTRARGAVARACATSAAITLVVCGWPLALGQFLFERDLLRASLPAWGALRAFIADPAAGALVEGVGAGSPLFAWPEATAFYPFTWLVLPLSLPLAGTLFALLHLQAAAAATTWLATTFRARPAFATMSGVAFAASGTVLDLVSHGNFIVAAPWVPCAWACARRMRIPRWRCRFGVGFAICLLMLLLGGEPHAVAIACAIASIDTVLASRSPRAAARLLAILAVPAASGVLLAAFFWIPILDEARLTARAAAVEESDRYRFALNAGGALAVLAPGIWSNAETDGALLGPRVAGPSWNPQPFLGAPLFAATLAGLAAARRRRSAPVIFAGATLLALGDTTPLLPLLDRVVPLLDRFRYPAKYLTPASLAAVLCAFLLLDHCARRGSAHLRRRAIIAAVTLAAMLLLAALALRLGVGGAFARGEDPIGAAAIEVLPGKLAFAACGAFALALSLRRSALHGAAVCAVWILLATPQHLAWGREPLTTLGPYAALAQAGSPGELHSVCVDPTVETQTLRRQGLDARAARDLGTRMLLLPDTQALSGLGSPVPYCASLTPRTGYQYWKAFEHGPAHIVAASGCNFFVGLADASRRGFSRTDESRLGLPPGAFARLPAAVYQLDRAPKSFVLSRAVWVDDERGVFAAMSAASDTAGALQVVDDPLARLTPPLPPLVDGTIKWQVQASDRIMLDVAGSGAMLVGVRTRFLSGWRARQGGIELPVLRSAGQHVAVLVTSPANGTVTLEYRVPRLGEGVAATCVGAALLAAFALRAARRARVLRSPPP